MLSWIVAMVRDWWRGYSDMDIESMHQKLRNGSGEFSHREHTAYLREVQEEPGDER